MSCFLPFFFLFALALNGVQLAVLIKMTDRPPLRWLFGLLE